MKSNINILIRSFKLKTWFEKVVQRLEKVEKIKSDQMSVVIVADQRIKTLNRKYRKKNKVTDVLSFVESDINQKYKLSNDSYLGEIFINFRQAERQAKDLKTEMLNLLVHGYLHLRGYTHDNDREMKRIKELTEKIIKKIK
jgi:probable rRNA maturation factor